MKTEPLLLVFDVGTGSGRCLIFDSNGYQVARAVSPWHYQTAESGSLFFDPQRWWADLIKLGREALAVVDPGRIVAISATSQRHGFVGFNLEGQELYGWPNLDRSVQSRLTVGAAEHLYPTVGRWPGAIHTAPRLAAASSIYTFLPLSDWVLYRLSGVKASDPSQAAESCLFDINLRDWSATAIQTFGLADRLLPDLQSSGTILGELSNPIAKALGLPSGIPVVSGGADTQCGTLGCGVVGPGEMALIAGTSAPLQLCLDQPLIDPLCRTITSPYLLEGQWVLESNAMFTGLSYARLSELIAPGQDFGELNQAMASASPEFTGLPLCIGSSIMDSRHGSLLPWGGMLFPLPFARYEPLTLLRAALESAAFAVRANLEQLKQVCNHFPAESLRMGGGAARGFWPQLVADSCQHPVLVSEEAEVSGLGTAMCAATGVGLFADLKAAALAMHRTGQKFEPRPIKSLDHFYQRWRAAYQGLARLALA